MNFSVEKLPCGAGLAVAEMPQVESISMGLWFGVGGRHEPERLNGVSHFIEHMIFKGTRRRNAREISEAVEGVGGYLNAFTAEEMTCYFAKAGARHFPLVCDVLSDMFLNSTFPQEEIERERGVICEEIRMYDDQPQQVSQEKLNTLVWAGHPLGRPLAGTVKRVQRMSRCDLINYKAKHYHAGNLWISIAGKITPTQAREMLNPLLKRLSHGRAITNKSVRWGQTSPRLAVVRKPIEQSHIALGLRGISRHDSRRFHVRLLSVILGENMSSRLFQSIREKHGLAYSIQSSVSYMNDSGSFGIYAGVENGKLSKALQLILKTVKQVATKGVTEEELSRAKEYTLGQMALSLESTTNQMMWMGEHAIAHGKVTDPSKVSERIEAVTTAEIHSAARFLFRDERLNLAVVSPVAEEKDLRKLNHF
jgi:predicted Zn-dependent peptidase